MVATVFIDGEAGTTGLQIRERLAARRDMHLLSIDHDKRKDTNERKRLLNAADVAILCLPDAAAKESVALIENDTTRVIDASTAHRVADGWTYGFAEMDTAQSKQIASARWVTNPGCWPQGVIATVRPLINAGLMRSDHPVTVHGISGYSGGGNAMITDYEARGENANHYWPYALTMQHKHIPEMQVYGKLTSRPLFTPTVGDFRQGMVTFVPLQLATFPSVPTLAQLHAAIADHYAATPNSVVELAPLNDATDIDPQAHNDTNHMRLYVHGNDDSAQAVLVAVYDNLGKGASGAAVQNLELMLGLTG